MNPEIKAQWVKALESGEYKQGKGWLNPIEPDGTETFCCLGVLCDLAAVKAGVAERKNSSSVLWPHRNYGSPAEYMSESQTLPPAVMAWAGLHDDNPMVTYSGEMACIAELNDGIAITDGEGLKFPEIAKIINEQL